LNRIPGLGHNDGMAMDIFEEIVRLRRSGLKAALATIVARRGSTPRKDAAKMIILEDGSLIGSIGGGCTEADVCREAANVIRLEKSILISFDLTEDEREGFANMDLQDFDQIVTGLDERVSKGRRIN